MFKQRKREYTQVLHVPYCLHWCTGQSLGPFCARLTVVWGRVQKCVWWPLSPGATGAQRGDAHQDCRAEVEEVWEARLPHPVHTTTVKYWQFSKMTFLKLTLKVPRFSMTSPPFCLSQGIHMCMHSSNIQSPTSGVTLFHWLLGDGYRPLGMLQCTSKGREEEDWLVNMDVKHLENLCKYTISLGMKHNFCFQENSTGHLYATEGFVHLDQMW